MQEYVECTAARKSMQLAMNALTSGYTLTVLRKYDKMAIHQDECRDLTTS